MGTNAAKHAATIEPMSVADWPAVQAIYAEAIAGGLATFETEVPNWDRWEQSHLKRPRLVARLDDAGVGWAALSPVSDRCVYGGVAECSVYVAAPRRGMGIGAALLRALVEGAEQNGIWTVQAGVFPENIASVRLLEGCGFRQVGVRERLGRLGGTWRDVLLLERRSRTVGVS